MLRLLLSCLVLTSAAAAEAGRSFRLPALYHVGFWVRDIAKAREFYHGFLGFEEPYSLNYPDGRLQMVVMKVNERQVIYLFTDATKILPNGDNLDHLGLETDNLAAVREHLLASGIKVGDIHRGRIGDLLLGVKDPDGHNYEITQLVPEGQLLQHQGQALPATRVSAHLRAATISVGDVTASLHFYVDILGFKKISDHPLRLQVPDGTDYLEFAPSERRPGAEAPRAVPAFIMDVESVPKTADMLRQRATAGGFPPPEANRREVSVVDPDGTKVSFR